MADYPADDRDRIEALREEISGHAHRYYDLDDPSVSDQEYDQLMRELKTLEARYPELVTEDSPTQVIRAIASSDMKKVTHSVPMLSLTDYFSEEDVLAFIRRVQEQVRSEFSLEKNEDVAFSVEQKIDGLSVSLEYRDGKFVRGATRGDGHIGEDVTANLLTLDDVPKSLNEPVPFLVVRGEVYMTEASFRSLNEVAISNGGKLFANPRNAAAGSLRQLNPDITKSRKLNLFVFNIQQVEGKSLSGHMESMRWLAELGLPTIRAASDMALGDPDTIWAAIESIEEERSTLPYSIDGAVIKLDRLDYRSLLGETSKVPRWAAAYKYKAEQGETRILDITVQVGRSGKLTPLAVLEPVLVQGSTISRATLHNEDYVALKDIRVGDTVLIEKAGDIIPAVVQVDLERRPPGTRVFVMPASCPVCGSQVLREEGEAASYCTGADCPAQIERRVIHFASKNCMDIRGMGEGVVKRLLEENFIQGIADIYRLRERREDLVVLSGFKDKSVDNLLTGIEQSKKNPLYRLIAALGIKHIGQQAARILAEAFTDIRRIMDASGDELVSLPDFGRITAEATIDFFHNEMNRQLIEELLSLGVEAKDKPKSAAPDVADSFFSGKTVVLTGGFQELTREQAGEELRRLGANVSGAVSSKTDILIHGEKAGSKLKKAEQLGINLMDEAGFMEMLRKPIDDLASATENGE